MHFASKTRNLGSEADMSRRKNPLSRCLACHMRKELCLCGQIRECRDSIKNTVRIHILMHHRERHLTTNTGRLAALSIPHCQVHYRGLPNKALNCAELVDSERENLVLFPHDDAEVLSPDFLKKITKPITLLVPDGSWRQAYKVAKREDAFSNLKRVVLPLGKISEYKLRREPKAHGLATFEAIARALGIVDCKETQDKLETVFRLMVERILRSRGYVNPATR